MGYYTKFDLSIVTDTFSSPTIYDIMEENPDFPGLGYAIDRYGNCYDEAKWYDHESDMKDLSRKYPDIIFCLEGEGEDRDDYWRDFYKNGKRITTKGTIVFEKPNLSLLD